MRFVRIVAALAIAAPGAAGAQGAVVVTDQVRAELVAYAPRGLLAGEPAWLGLAIAHQPHWHSYWKNPGDSGMATTLAWTLPRGVIAGPIEWPTPQRLPVGPLVNYGFEGKVLLPVALKLPADFGSGALDVTMQAQWLVCKDVCIPQSGDFALRVARAPSAQHAAAFARARAALPQPVAGASGRARVEGSDLSIDVSGLPRSWHGKSTQFFAEDGGVIEHAAPVRQQWRGEVLSLRMALSSQRSESPQPMRAVLVAAGERAGAALSFTVDGGWPALGGVLPQVQAPDAPRAHDFWWPGLAAGAAALALGGYWALRRRRRGERR